MQKISLKKSITQSLNRLSINVAKTFNDHNIYAINVMASPGAGKTSLLLKIVESLNKKYPIGVIEGDVVLIDVDKFKKLNIPVVLAQTGGACHLDAPLISKAIKKLPLNKIKLILIENVGNLICPANFNLGTHLNLVIASTPEGDDKPLKYPNMFKTADVVVLNKIDIPDTEFRINEFETNLYSLNPNIKFFPLSCRSNQGLNKFLNYLKSLIDQV